MATGVAGQTRMRSLAEIQSLATKAARGAGCHWGMAEEAGMSARLLECHDLPGTAHLAHLLITPRTCHCHGADAAPACGISALARLSDRLGELRDDDWMTFTNVLAPLLLVVPLILGARRTGRSYRLAFAGREIGCTPEGLVLRQEDGDWPVKAQTVIVAAGSAAEPTHRPTPNGREVDADALGRLEALAARTLVPETDASRRSGAGPGAQDVD